MDVISPKSEEIQAFKHDTKSLKITVDRTLDDARPDEYDAIVLPGGGLNADAMRMQPAVQSFIKAMHNAGKPFAVICHAPWVADQSAGPTSGNHPRPPPIEDDVRNAGANWVDQEVVVDGNLVTSRQPGDIPAFNREMLNLFSKTPAGTR